MPAGIRDSGEPVVAQVRGGGDDVVALAREHRAAQLELRGREGHGAFALLGVDHVGNRVDPAGVESVNMSARSRTT